MTKRSAEAGFTLTEVLMTLLLISILVAVAVPQFTDFGNDAKAAVTRERLNSIKAAIIGDARLVAAGQLAKPGYEANCAAVPSALADLIIQPASGSCAQVYNPFTQKGWRGPYLITSDSTWNRDSWGTALQYSSASRRITSCGADRSCGNSDDIAVTF